MAWPHFSGFHEKVAEIELAKEVAQGASLRKELRKRKRGWDSSQVMRVKGCRALPLSDFPPIPPPPTLGFESLTTGGI